MSFSASKHQRGGADTLYVHMLTRIVAALPALVVAGLAAGCASTGATPRPFPTPSPPADTHARAGAVGLATADVKELIDRALDLRGTPYRNGGSDPKGFDCSGFTQWVFAKQGVVLPREVSSQFHMGRPVNLDRVQPGDLIFFATTASSASHVGLVIGGGQFVHAPSSRGVVRIERYSAAYWADRFVGVRRIGREAGDRP